MFNAKKEGKDDLVDEDVLARMIHGAPKLFPLMVSKSCV